jgi:hypothetical protein
MFFRKPKLTRERTAGTARKQRGAGRRGESALHLKSSNLHQIARLMNDRINDRDGMIDMMAISDGRAPCELKSPPRPLITTAQIPYRQPQSNREQSFTSPTTLPFLVIQSFLLLNVL